MNQKVNDVATQLWDDLGLLEQRIESFQDLQKDVPPETQQWLQASIERYKVLCQEIRKCAENLRAEAMKEA